MREQLIQYVELLFAAAPNSGEIKQEILQNTLDRYDDLVEQGKSPEAAYRLAISGIGDINEILGGEPQQAAHASPSPSYKTEVKSAIHEETEDIRRRNMQAVAVAFYILCPMPLIALSEFGFDTIGLFLMFLMIAAATALLIMAGKGKEAPENGYSAASHPHQQSSPQMELKKSIGNVVWAVGLAAYFILSFATQAWYITWVLFPIIGSVQGLANAIVDLKEASRYEK